MTWRHELKFYITAKDIEVLKNRLNNLMNLDPHQGKEGYTIRSLYLDTINDDLLEQGLSGLNNRVKYRFRFYNDDIKNINLEKKITRNNLKTKIQEKVSIDTMNNYLKNYLTDIEDNKKLLMETIANELRPNIVIEYDRYAFVNEVGNVRITFDVNIRASLQKNRFLKEDLLLVPVLPINKHILEVKYDNILPGYIAKVLNLENLTRVSFSKYTICRNVLDNNGIMEGVYDI